MRKLAALLVAGGLLAVTSTGQATADSKAVVTCSFLALATAGQVLIDPCGGSTGVIVPTECDAAGDSAAECTATLLNQGFKLESSVGVGTQTGLYIFVKNVAANLT